LVLIGINYLLVLIVVIHLCVRIRKRVRAFREFHEKLDELIYPIELIKSNQR